MPNAACLLEISALGSIPIARSITPVDEVGFTGFPPKIAPKMPDFGRSWTELVKSQTSWTQFFRLAANQRLWGQRTSTNSRLSDQRTQCLGPNLRIDQQ